MAIFQASLTHRTMDMVIDVVEQVITMAPVPYLQPAVQVFKIIWGKVGQAKANKRQIQAIAQTVAQILLALNSQAISNDLPGKWEDKWMRQNRSDFEKLLSRIAEFCTKTAKKKFVKSFLDSSGDQDEINSIHTQLNLSVDAFQIGSQVSMQNYNKRVEIARQEDQAEINAALRQLLEKQDTLLALVGHPETEILPPSYNEADLEAGNVQGDAQKTIFGLLGDIQDSVKQASAGTERDEVLQEVLLELRKVSTESTQPPPDPNPIVASLNPGLSPNVLITPLQWKMNTYMRKEALTQHLYSQQIAKFRAGPDASRLFMEYLLETDDMGIKYAALEVFQQDPNLKHYFKQ